VRRLRVALVLGAVLALSGSTMAGAAPSAKSNQSADSAYAGSNVDTSTALVQLNGDPLSTYVKTKPSHGKKIDFNSNTVKSYRAQLSALRNDFKQWLQATAPKAKITGSWDLALNAVSVRLNGTSLATLATAPQVKHAEYVGLYHPDGADPDLAIIDAVAAWDLSGGAEDAGAGVKVAILDTGIDITHPCFADDGYAAQTQLGDHDFTNNKVIVAKVFSNKTPSRGYTPEALQEHGTHVAGTVACNFETPVNVDGVAVPYAMSGVAPRALLGNYNIFPGEVGNARSEDILNALEAAYMDGMDVANMSLGGGASGIQDLLTMAVDDLDAANMVVAVAAGNSAAGNGVPPHLQAPGHYTVESPGSAARALTAGASTVGHFIGIVVTDEDTSDAYAAAIGEFGPAADASGDLTANLGTYCAGGGTYTGKIALIDRGTCSFSTKIRNAQNAGAVGAIIVNNVYGPPISMAQDGTANQPTIPAVSVSKSDQTALGAATGHAFTIGSTPSYVADPAQNDFVAGFSSQGPTDVDFRVKPDVVAPGVNVLSSIPHQFCDVAPCFAFFQGTSMATPHLAGSAAVVRQQHPDWSAAQVRSAIVNTADEGVLYNSNGSVATDVNIIGSGRENLFKAVQASVALDPVSVSFGAIPSGSGQSASFPVTITDLTGAGGTFYLYINAVSGSGVEFGLSQPSVTLSAGGSATFWVTLDAAKGADPGNKQARLYIEDGEGLVAHAVVYTYLK
jgi:minor extracellular serine protease Vpr